MIKTSGLRLGAGTAESFCADGSFQLSIQQRRPAWWPGLAHDRRLVLQVSNALKDKHEQFVLVACGSLVRYCQTVNSRSMVASGGTAQCSRILLNLYVLIHLPVPTLRSGLIGSSSCFALIPGPGTADNGAAGPRSECTDEFGQLGVLLVQAAFGSALYLSPKKLAVAPFGCGKACFVVLSGLIF